METRTLGIILNGVTGRMGTNQHLIRSILAIMKQGGVKVSDELRLMPEPILTGRNADRLREAWVQSISETPKPVWNPDIAQPINFLEGWQQVPAATNYDNAFKIQWELFLRHVALDEPFRWSLREGAKGVQLAELGIKSWKERRWVDVPEL